ncbi:unnamed protein product [Adineta steineri]|uniref:CCR4-NOT transcription complex subunit 3 n=1 Tax=Adineta steineri TaxID=433720 RepID=A0A815LVT3_9BILA|nr:unnamed protein product [Adineta steineri]
MGDRRKLQGEIDRCLKKVTEGVETFDDIWQKVHSAPNHNQKDKYEQELKKEIKKLQRLRDQIKAWISSTEIKDKKSLQEARKNIELQMERFKIVERETKTKAYSKEGLGAGQKLDPQEKEKEECNQWIAEAIQELNIQIDKFESDIETLSASLKKKKSDKDKQERLEDTKHSIERHKFHIESLEKILRAINNDALDLKTIHNLRADIEYYVESNQDSDFKENELMYEEIDMDDLTTLMAPVIAVPITQSHPPSLSNGSSSLNSNATSNHIDIISSSMNINSLTNHSSDRTTTTNSNHGDNESMIGLTTPSSTQASSPSASPALSLTDDRKRNKSESEDNQSQRNRSNSGANNSSATQISSPKALLQSQQQSPSLLSSTKPILSSAPSSASILSTSAPPHFTYPVTTTSTLPVLQYSAIVSHNTVPSTSTTTTSSNTITSKQQQHILSPPTKQQSRQLPNGTGSLLNTNESIVTTTSTLPISSVTTTVTNSSNTSHPPSLLSTTNDRSGILSQHILNNISSQINVPSSSSPITAPTISSPLCSSSGSGLSNSNIPLESSPSSSSNAIDPAIVSQQSSLLPLRTTSENDRSTIMSNGSSDGHSLLDNAFSNIPSSSSSSLFLSNTNSNIGDIPATNGGVIGQLASGIPLNPDHHSLRYMLPSTSLNILHQQTIPTGRVPLTQAEVRMLSRLNSAYTKLPSLLESERQRTNGNRIYGRSLLSQSQAVPYYPQTPPSGSDAPEFYYRLAPDTLFFVFYYMEGTRAQYLAAKALKRQSWRFHTKHMMWFQRHEEPKTITDDYEQGTYIFFDYERWQTRKRDNFIFEYKFLEDREF